MKITVDGSVVYLGKCETGVYVYVGEQSQGDSPIPVDETESILNGVLVDYAESGEVIGVEILVPTGDSRAEYPCECLDGGHKTRDGTCMCGGFIRR